MSCELLEGVVAAYGGADLWRNSRVVEATISSGGLGFAIKWHRGQRRRRVSAQISRPEITIETRARWQLWNFRGKKRPHRISVGANCGQPTRRGYLFSRWPSLVLVG